MAPDDAEDYDDDELSDDGESEGPEVGVTIEIVGLSLYTHHGVSAAEREVGQRLVLDVRFDVGEPDALVTDRVEDTVDYGEVCQVIALIAQQRSYKTLERLCAVIADRLASQFNADSVTVKASKPEPPIPLPVEEVSVEAGWEESKRAKRGRARTEAKPVTRPPAEAECPAWRRGEAGGEAAGRDSTGLDDPRSYTLVPLIDRCPRCTFQWKPVVGSRP